MSSVSYTSYVYHPEGTRLVGEIKGPNHIRPVDYGVNEFQNIREGLVLWILQFVYVGVFT